MIIYPTISAIILEKIVGIGLIIFGCIKLIGYYSKDLFRLAFQYDLSFGILLIILGIIILIANGGTLTFLCIAVGIAMLSDGLFKIQIADDSRRFGIKSWWAIMVLAILTCISGIVLIFRPAFGTELLIVLFGITLLMEGILNLTVALNTVKIVKTKHSDVIDM